MEKLNELAELARLCDSMKSSVDANAAYANFICRIEPKDITAIAEAFRELEQRAEAAEAENARLTRNYKHIIEQHMPRTSDGCDKGWTRVIEAHELQAKLEAAEAKLAELVPPEADGSNLPFAANGWNACRAEILRKIEEAK